MTDTDARAAREGWVDAAKGIAIILVVLFHAIIFPADLGLAWRWEVPAGVLDTFRMPLFFFTAGLFATKAIGWNLRALFARRVARLIWLYLLWSLIWAVVFFIIPIAENEPTNLIDNVLLLLVWPNVSTWFVYVLAAYFVCAWLIKRLPLWSQFAIAAAISIAFGTQWIDTGNDALDKAGIYFLFFLTAVHVGRIVRQLAPQVRPWHTILAIILYSAVALVAVKFDLLNLPGVRIFVSFLAVAVGIALAVTLHRWRLFGWLAALGSRTLPIYLVHFYAILITLAVLAPFASNLRPLGPVIPFVLTALAILFSLGVHRLTRRITWLWALPTPLARALERAPRSGEAQLAPNS